MNAHRNTDVFTPLAYLNWIQRGSTADWKRLYELCKEAKVARAVAVVLVQRDPDLTASARLWKYLLEDLHPELDIDLRLERRNPGV
jgi:hypothetical protein